MSSVRVIAPSPNKERGAGSSSLFPKRKSYRLILRASTALAFIVGTTLVLNRFVPGNGTIAGFLYVVVILVIATKGGLVESTVASFGATLCFNWFFLPPLGSITFADPENGIALFALLATSLTASQLSVHAKRRALEAEERRGEIERLYALSQALLQSDATQPIAKQIIRQIALTCEFHVVALYVCATGEIYLEGTEDHEIERKLRDSAIRSTVVADDKTNFTIIPIRLGSEPIGSLGFSGGKFSDAALQSLMNLVAIGLERDSSQKAMNRAEVARQSEELKSTLLDAIAHEFKTPLTAIKAVTTDLLSRPHTQLRPERELIGIVDVSADRLSKLVTDAIQLARIEGGTFRLNLGNHFPSSLVNGALRQMKSLTEDRSVEVQVPDDLPPVRVDSELIQVVLTNLLDNALKYSPPSNPITIGARLKEDKVIVFLADRGQGIGEEEQGQIFEKFYRGKGERHQTGTGMGLAIAQEILRAHGEDISLSSAPGKGSEFSFGLPIMPGGSPR